MNTMTNWVASGMAQEAARELAWFVVIMFVVIGYLIWRQDRKEKRDE